MPDEKTARTRGTAPNIIYIQTDQQTFEALGAHTPGIVTPHLDGLAEKALRFDHCYSVSPSCVPSRAAVYTGRYPSQCGVPTYVSWLGEHETTYMTLLQQAGYYTACIGKQHFAEATIKRGYDYEDMQEYHTPPFPYWDGDQRLIDLYPGQSYYEFLRDNGVKDPRALFREYDRAGCCATEWVGEKRFHPDDFVGERAREWLEDRLGGEQAGDPFYVHISFPGPHFPYDVSFKPYTDHYPVETVPMPQTCAADLEGKPDLYGKKKWKDMSDEEIAFTRQHYFANMTLIDEKAGALLEALIKHGAYEDSLIIFASDHGDFMGEFGLMYKGQYVSDALMHIPLIIKPPGGKARGVRGELVQNIDIAGTILGTAGIPVPDTMAARDLSGLWRADGPAPEERAHVYLEAWNMRGIRTAEWKYVWYQDRPYGELYDAVGDPHEKVNRWDDPECAEIKAELKDRLLSHIVDISPNHRPNTWAGKGSPEI